MNKQNLLTLGIVVILIVGAIIIIALTGGTTEEPSVDTTDTTQQTSETTDDATTETEETEPESEATDTETDTESASYTMSEVESHDSQDDCWAVVRGEVYDLTDWVNAHPGGASAIARMCGTDGTSAFEGQHGGWEQAESTLAGFKIGVLAE